MAAVLEAIGTTIGEVAERVGPSVVGIGRGWGVGSGIVVADGRVLTNAHVVRRDETTVQFADGRRERGVVAGVDTDGDLAVIEVDTGDAPVIAWADPDPEAAPVGTPIFALANPGGRGLRVTFGTVSSAKRAFRGPRGRRIQGAIEHTAPPPRGSSGGPLVDAAGNLLGVNSIRLDGNLILALTVDEARVDRLAAGEQVERPRLGVAVAPAHVARRLRRAVGLPDQPGILIRGVVEGGPADAAGFERGDLIVQAAGKDVQSLDDLYGALEGKAPGDELAIKAIRGTDEREATLTLGA